MIPRLAVGERAHVALAGGSRTALAVVLAFAAGGALVEGASLPGRLLVFVVVIAVQLARRLPGGSLAQQAVSLAALPLVAIVTSLLGELMLHDRTAGDALVVLSLWASSSLRRARPWVARSARLLALPATVLFVAPVPVRASGSGGVVWYALLSLAAGACVVAADRVVGRLAPAARAAVEPRAPARPSRLRPSPTARVGLHMAIGLTLAFAIGQRLFPDRYGWMVVSVLAISSGLRSRGDVLLRGGERLLGALVGTAAATLAAAAIGDDKPVAIAVIALLLLAGSLLREVTYVAWAFCVTSVLGLLYGLYGEHGTHLLGERLEQNAIGALCVIVPSCLLLPIPTTLVVRRRVADLLAALDALLVALPERAAGAERETVAAAHVALVDAIRSLRLLGRVTRRRPEALALADAALAQHDAARALAATAPDRASAGELRRRVGELRRSLAGRDAQQTHSGGQDSTAGSQRLVAP